MQHYKHVQWKKKIIWCFCFCCGSTSRLVLLLNPFTTLFANCISVNVIKHCRVEPGVAGSTLKTVLMKHFFFVPHERNILPNYFLTSCTTSGSSGFGGALFTKDLVIFRIVFRGKGRWAFGTNKALLVISHVERWKTRFW